MGIDIIDIHHYTQQFTYNYKPTFSVIWGPPSCVAGGLQLSHGRPAATGQDAHRAAGYRRLGRGSGYPLEYIRILDYVGIRI